LLEILYFVLLMSFAITVLVRILILAFMTEDFIKTKSFSSALTMYKKSINFNGENVKLYHLFMPIIDFIPLCFLIIASAIISIGITICNINIFKINKGT